MFIAILGELDFHHKESETVYPSIMCSFKRKEGKKKLLLWNGRLNDRKSLFYDNLNHGHHFLREPRVILEYKKRVEYYRYCVCMCEWDYDTNHRVFILYNIRYNV